MSDRTGPQGGKGRRIAAWVVIALVGLALAVSAIAKLAGHPVMVAAFEHYGLAAQLKLIGSGELVVALLYLIPRTHSAGLLLASAHLGGAIVTHMQHNEPFLAAAVLLVLAWLGGWLRHPEVLQSFRVRAA
jgi:hypothetical protein